MNMLRFLLPVVALLPVSAFATQTFICTALGIDGRSPSLSVFFNVGAMGSLSNDSVTVSVNGQNTKLSAPGFWLDEKRVWIRAVDDQATRDVLMLKFNFKSKKGIVWYEKAIPAGQPNAPVFPLDNCEG